MFTRLWKIGNTTLFDLQFVGDGMLAFFNAPHAVSDHAAQACQAAQAAQHSLDQFNRRRTMHCRSRRASVWRQRRSWSATSGRHGTCRLINGRAGPLLGVTGIAGAGLPDLLTDTGTNMTKLRGSPREGRPHQPAMEAGKRNP
jgi:hypothetical protein